MICVTEHVEQTLVEQHTVCVISIDGTSLQQIEHSLKAGGRRGFPSKDDVFTKLQ